MLIRLIITSLIRLSGHGIRNRLPSFALSITTYAGRVQSRPRFRRGG
jgi:hypothetical protein